MDKTRSEKLFSIDEVADWYMHGAAHQARGGPWSREDLISVLERSIKLEAGIIWDDYEELIAVAYAESVSVTTSYYISQEAIEVLKEAGFYSNKEYRVTYKDGVTKIYRKKK
jgi:hypothetical protein